MSLGTSEALHELLTACCRADQVAALHTLGLHPGLINERWAGDEFYVAGGVGYVSRGENAIMVASAGGNEALVLELVKRGAEVNARGEDGFDALMYASWKGRTAVVAVLLNHGADPNTRTHSWTALGLAAAHDNLPICLLLVARAADLYAVNAVIGGRSALEGYGRDKYPRLAPAVLEESREALRVAFAEGPHESQVQRRRDERWARRWPCMLIMAGHDFQPLIARQLMLLLLNPPLPPDVSIPPVDISTVAQRRAFLNMAVFGQAGLLRLIVSFL
jgi:hypothetical protein